MCLRQFFVPSVARQADVPLQSVSALSSKSILKGPETWGFRPLAALCLLIHQNTHRRSNGPSAHYRRSRVSVSLPPAEACVAYVHLQE